MLHSFQGIVPPVPRLEPILAEAPKISVPPCDEEKLVLKESPMEVQALSHSPRRETYLVRRRLR